MYMCIYVYTYIWACFFFRISQYKLVGLDGGVYGTIAVEVSLLMKIYTWKYMYVYINKCINIYLYTDIYIDIHICIYPNINW
jgi:hypothetical protein